MHPHSFLATFLMFAGLVLLPTCSYGQSPNSFEIPDFMLLSPDWPGAAKYAITDGAKMKADPNYHVDTSRFVVRSGKSEAEICEFLKTKKLDSIFWMEFMGGKGSKLPAKAAQEAAIAKFKKDGIEVKIAQLAVFPPIVDPPSPPGQK